MIFTSPILFVIFTVRSVFADCNLDPGFDYWGHDITGGKPVATVEDCCKLCDATEACKFFSFITTKPTFCHLKDSRAGRQANKQRISGSKTGGPAPPAPRPDFYYSCTKDLAGGPRLNTPMCNASLPIEARIKDILSRMTYQEKCAALDNGNPAVPRLGLPSMKDGESTHGVSSGCGAATGSGPNATTGCPTSFPSGTGLGAAFDEDLYMRIGTAIGREARALNNQGGRSGLYFLDPNINLQRDPRWGRSQEVPGEDPLLTARYAAAIVTGTQEEQGGLDPRYLQAAATLKHFTMYDLEGFIPRTDPLPAPSSSHCDTPGGCERWNFDANPPAKDFAEYYMAPWEWAVKKARPAAIMCSYNAAFGQPTCANNNINNGLVRGQWGWSGFFVSDCTALELMQDVKWDNCQHPWPSEGGHCTPEPFPGGHNYTHTVADTVHAALVQGGIDYNCGPLYRMQLYAALEQGAVTKDDVDKAVARVYRTQIRLGMLDPMAGQVYLDLNASVVDSPEHRALALRAARESMVLLQNRPVPPSIPRGGDPDDKTPRGGDPDANAKPLLPLHLVPGSRVAVIGPHANSTQSLLSNYHGQNRLVDEHSPLAALRTRAGRVNATIAYARGCNICDYPYGSNPGFPNMPCPDGHATDTSGVSHAVQVAADADVAVLFLGSDQTTEAENFDRHNISLPGVQERLLREVVAVQPNTVVVLVHGGPLASEAMAKTVPAVLDAFYPGELGGEAIADTLLGENNPAGRLPYTVYHSNFSRDIREVDLRADGGITYQWFTGEVLYPFGHGLSYSEFDLKWAPKTRDPPRGWPDINMTIDDLLQGAKPDALSHPLTHPLTPSRTVNVTNLGPLPGDTVITAFLCSSPSSPPHSPLKRLVGFTRLRGMRVGETRTVRVGGAQRGGADAHIPITNRELSVVSEEGDHVLAPGSFSLQVGVGDGHLETMVSLVGGARVVRENAWARSD